MSEFICVRQNTSLPSYFDVTKFPKHNNLVRKTPGIPKKTFCLRYCEKGSVCFWASPMDLDPYCYNSVYAFSYELDQQYRSLLHFFYTFVKDIDNFHRYNICWKLLVKYDTWKVFGGKVWDISWCSVTWTGRNALTSKREKRHSPLHRRRWAGATTCFSGRTPLPSSSRWY